MNTNKNILKNIDKNLLITLMITIVYGLIVLSSASRSLAHSRRIMIAQIISTILGLILMFILIRIDYRVWRKIGRPIYVFSVALLALTLIFGEEVNNAKSWISIPIINLSFQPSEFTKIGIVLSFSAFLSKYHLRINEPRILLRAIILAIIPVALIYIQPDAGTAIVYMIIIVFMIFCAGISIKSILILGLIGLLMLPVLWGSLQDYQKNRIMDYLDPSANTQTSSYQVNQGVIASGSGKLTGKGLYKGNQTQAGFIPEKQNDFIFPVLVEELGFIGGIFLIILYANMIIRIFHISVKSKTAYGRFLTVGFGAMFVFHIIQNIGMTIGILPVTGIPLPFFSAGGTFQLINLAAMGLILSVSAHN